MRYEVDVVVYPGLPAERIILPNTLEEYEELWRHIERERLAQNYDTWKALMRLWSAGDHYFRLLFIMTAGREAKNKYRGEPHFKHPVHIELSRRIQFEKTDGSVLIAARGLGKSTHFSCDNIGRKLVDENDASVIFSLTRELAEQHLTVIATELTKNRLLVELWDDRFWRDVTDRTPGSKWSITDGLSIKRSSTRPEQSFEARAFKVILPTGMHYDKRYYDDIEADSSVESDLSMETTEQRYVSSQDLSSSKREKGATGTYYHPNGMMRKLEVDYGLTTWLYPGEDLRQPAHSPEEAGPLGGTPANGFTRDQLWDILKDKGGAFRDPETDEWRKKQNSIAWSSYGRQIACDPLAGEDGRLTANLFLRYEGTARELARRMVIIVCVDASGGLSDPTCIWVWGLTPEKEFYWLDCELKVLEPRERKREIHRVCSMWRDLGQFEQLRIEQFGSSEAYTAQVEYHQDLNFAVPKTIKCNDNTRDSLAGNGKLTGKLNRIYNRWHPVTSEGRVYIPHTMVREDERSQKVDLVKYFLEREWTMFPKPFTDNMLDAGSLVWEPEDRTGPLPWPLRRKMKQPTRSSGGTYMGAGMA